MTQRQALMRVAAVSVAVFATAGNMRANGEQAVDAARTPAIHQQQLASLTAMMRAVNRGDAEGYAGVYAEDAVITIYGSDRIEGRRAIQQHETELLTQFPGTRFALFSVWQTGRSAVVHYGVNGKTTSGVPMGHEGLLFYSFQASGAIQSEHRYLDSLTPMVQLGARDWGAARPPPRLPASVRGYVAKGSRGENDNAAIVNAALQSLDTNDRAGFVASVAADAVVDDLTSTQTFTGRQGVEAWVTRWKGAASDTRLEITTSFGVGDFVLVETVVRGRLSAALDRLSASETPFTIHRAVIARLRNKRIVSLAFFMNRAELARSVGQWPPG